MTVFLTVFYNRFLNMHYFRMYSLYMHDIFEYLEQTAWSYKHMFEAIYSFLPILKAEVINHMVQSFYLTLFLYNFVISIKCDFGNHSKGFIIIRNNDSSKQAFKLEGYIVVCFHNCLQNGTIACSNYNNDSLKDHIRIQHREPLWVFVHILFFFNINVYTRMTLEFYFSRVTCILQSMWHKMFPLSLNKHIVLSHRCRMI